MSMRVPACPVVILNHEALSGVMIMEGVIASGGAFCTAHSPFTPAMAGNSLEQIARLHSASHLLQDNPWIDSGMDWMVRSDRFPLTWLQGQMHDGRGSDLPEQLLDAGLLMRGMTGQIISINGGLDTSYSRRKTGSCRVTSPCSKRFAACPGA